MFARLNSMVEPTDFDQCLDHRSDVEAFNLDVGYHYHVNALGENQILAWLTGELGQ